MLRGFLGFDTRVILPLFCVKKVDFVSANSWRDIMWSFGESEN